MPSATTPPLPLPSFVISSPEATWQVGDSCCRARAQAPLPNRQELPRLLSVVPGKSPPRGCQQPALTSVLACSISATRPISRNFRLSDLVLSNRSRIDKAVSEILNKLNPTAAAPQRCGFGNVWSPARTMNWQKTNTSLPNSIRGISTLGCEGFGLS